MRVALAQIDTTVGAFEKNLEKVRRAAREATAAGADLVVFPEQTLPGYPARDFLELPEFVGRNVAALETLKAESGDAALVVGWAAPHGGVGAGLNQPCRTSPMPGLQSARGRIEESERETFFGAPNGDPTSDRAW
jgi:predicted amidohydrolase